MTMRAGALALACGIVAHAAVMLFGNALQAADLYAQAIGQPPPPEEPEPLPPATPPATTAPAPPTEPETTARAETADQGLRTKILIGAGIAAILAAIGGGGGGSDGAPASTSQTSP